MQTTPVTSQRIAHSVIAVPPLARDSQFRLSAQNNSAIVKHIESGGVEILLYGGNANFYHIGVSEFADTLQMLVEISGDKTLVVPSVGPAFGTMMDQAAVLMDFDFPTVMVLPQRDIVTSSGMATGIRKLSEKIQRPIVLYLKHDHAMHVDDVGSLVDDKLVSFIKYAVVRDDDDDDPYLSSIVARVDPGIIVSGIGEQPAIGHMLQFDLVGFTSGCVCIAPWLSMAMLKAIRDDDLGRAVQIRKQFEPLENLRNEVSPIRVLHEAVSLAGIARTGPMLPLLNSIDDRDILDDIEFEAKTLLEVNAF